MCGERPSLFVLPSDRRLRQKVQAKTASQSRKVYAVEDRSTAGRKRFGGVYESTKPSSGLKGFPRVSEPHPRMKDRGAISMPGVDWTRTGSGNGQAPFGCSQHDAVLLALTHGSVNSMSRAALLFACRLSQSTSTSSSNPRRHNGRPYPLVLRFGARSSLHTTECLQ